MERTTGIEPAYASLATMLLTLSASALLAPPAGFGPAPSPLTAGRTTVIRQRNCLDDRLGLEPRFRGSKPLVLPLDDQSVLVPSEGIELSQQLCKSRVVPRRPGVLERIRGLEPLLHGLEDRRHAMCVSANWRKVVNSNHMPRRAQPA
jgi:hypothetical protein